LKLGDNITNCFSSKKCDLLQTIRESEEYNNRVRILFDFYCLGAGGGGSGDGLYIIKQLK
jgi:hypothetical protein